MTPFTFHRPKPCAVAGFPVAPPKSTAVIQPLPKKKKPYRDRTQAAANALRTDEERKADRMKKATAFHPASNFEITSSTKNMGTAGSRFKTI